MKKTTRKVITGIAVFTLVFCAGAYFPTVGTLRISPVSLTAHAEDITAEFTVNDIVYRICNINGGTDIVRVEKYVGNSSEIVIPSEIEHTYTNSNGDEVTETVTVREINGDAFKGNLKIRKVTLPDTIETIWNNAFRDCSNLESINFPEGLKSIEWQAFGGTRLTSVSLPSSLENIKEWAFASCTRLKTVTFAENSRLSLINTGAFYNCSALTSFDMPSDVISIGNNAFQSDTKLTAVTLPEGLTTLGEGAFKYSGLKSITLPSTLKDFSSTVFLGCASLAEVVLPNNMATIPDETFRDCTALKTVNFPSALTSIGAWAFENTSISGELNCSEDFEFIGISAFGGDNTNIKLIMNSDIRIGGSVGGITEVIFNDGVTFIPNGMFSNNEKLKKVTFAGNDIRVIGENAFEWTGALRTVILSDSITEIQGGAFHGSGITSLDMGNGVEIIGAGAFDGSKLKTTNFSNNLQRIGSNAFKETLLTGELVLPDSLEIIEDSAFCSTKITSLKTGKNLQTLCAGAFNYCEYLTKITLNEGLETIGDYAFDNCNIMGKLIIPEGVTSIGNSAFEQQQISSLTLPSTLETVGDWAFYNMVTNIETVVIPEGVTKLGYASFWGCGIKHLTLPETLEYIGDHCFGNDTPTSIVRWGDNAIEGTVVVSAKYVGKSAFTGNNITEVIFKDGVETIKNGAFTGLPIKKLYLPDSVKTIEGAPDMFSYGAFSSCRELEEIEHFPAEIEELGEGVFQYCESLNKIAPLPSTLTTVPSNLFDGCTSLTGTLQLNEGIRIIDTGAFNGCKLTGVNIPYSLTMIRDSAFAGNKINYVELRNVTYIGINAFANNIDYSFDRNNTEHYAVNQNNRFIVIPETVEYIGGGAFGSFSFTTSDDVEYRGAVDGFVVKGCSEVAKEYAESIEHGVQTWMNGQSDWTNAENNFIYQEIEHSQGDCNFDGEFNIADLVTFQKYLLKSEETRLSDWESADLNGDGKLNVFDMTAMRKKIVAKL